MYKILFLIVPLFGFSVGEKDTSENVSPPVSADFKTCYCQVHHVDGPKIEMRLSKECIDNMSIVNGNFKKRMGDVLIASDFRDREPKDSDACYAHKYVYLNKNTTMGRFYTPRFERTEILTYSQTVNIQSIPSKSSQKIIYVFGGLVPNSGDIDFMKASIQELEASISTSNENLTDSLNSVVEDFETSIRKEVIEGFDSIPLRVIESEAIQQLKNDFNEQIKKLQEQIDELNANQE